MTNEHPHKDADQVETGGSLGLSGRLVAQKISKDATEAIRVADSQGRCSTTDLDVDGSLRYSIDGPSPQGETGSLEVCKILIERLNHDGSHWGTPSKPEGPEGGIDCVASDGAQRLHIQVTRAVDKRLWNSLANSGSAVENTTVESAADDLRSAVKHKESIPPGQRAGILLALDAMDTASHALDAVAQSFRRRYGPQVRTLGFMAIWVVGPTAALTMRLDSNELSPSDH